MAKVASVKNINILSHVYNEIKGDIKNQLDNQILFLKDISIIEFAPKGKMLLEYAELIKTRGKEESACMAYCKYNQMS